MNIIEARRTLTTLAVQAQAIVDSKGLTNNIKSKQLDDLKTKMDEAKSVLAIHQGAAALLDGGSALPAGMRQVRAARGLSAKGLATPAIQMSPEDTEQAFTSLKSGSNFRVEMKDTANSEATRGDLPPQLQGIVERRFEANRILDHIPSTTTEAAAIEFISHVSNTPGLGTPVLALGTVASGGTFAAGTYYWKITALASGGETVGSNEVTATLTASQKQPLTWAAITGADGYRVYRGTAAGAENVLVGAVTGGATTTYTDTGAAGTNATVPTVDRTAGARIVAAGGQIPETSLVTQKTILQAQKVAVFTTETDEILADYPTFTQYTEVELTRQVTDAENYQILHGSGSGEILGLLNTSGTLTRAKTGTDTSLDTLEEGITDLRNGPSYAVADLLVINPQTWSTIRRTKDAYGRYLLGDPGQTVVNDVWGVPVLQTTQIVPGVAVLASMELAAQAWIREGVTLSMSNSNNDDFENGRVAVRAEERIILGVARPTAINIITGL